MGFLRRQFSRSRTRLFLFMLLAWVLPVLLMGYNIFYFQSQMRDQALSYFGSGVHYSMRLTDERLAKAVAALKKASYDKSLGVVYLRFVDGAATAAQLYAEADRFVRSNYVDMDDTRLAYIEVNGATPASAHATRYANEEFTAFRQDDLPAIRDLAAGMVNETRFYLNPHGALYAYRALTTGDTVMGLSVFKLETSYIFGSLMDDRFPQKTLQFSLPGVSAAMNGAAARFNPWDEPVTPPEEPARAGGQAVCGGSFHNADYSLAYAAQIDGEILFGGYTLYMRIMLLTGFLFLAILVYYNLISRPVTRLTRAISRMELSKLGVQVDANERNEFRFLFGAFEGMSHKLIALQEQTYKKELAARDAKIESLRSQINPHFINNTLELMSWQARMGDTEGVAKMVDAMVVMMDAAMNRGGRKSEPLIEEIQYARAYFHIISERYGTRLILEEDLPDPLPDAQVPPLILQPLLENAVKHGIEPNGGGRLLLRIRDNYGILHIDVVNTGRPLSDSDKRRVAASFTDDGYHASIGLSNIYQRLKLIYGDAATVDVFTDGRETVSRVTLPMNMKD